MPMSKLTKYRNRIRIGVAAVVLGAVGVGGFTVVNGLAVARADHQAQVAAAAEDAAEQSAMEQDMYAAADVAKKAQDAADEAAYQQFLVDKAAAEAKAAADAKAAEDARVAAEAQAAADAAAKAATKAPSRSSSNSGGVVKCPAGTKANAVDAAGNESACESLGAGGEQCQAYDENNTCTNWYKP